MCKKNSHMQETAIEKSGNQKNNVIQHAPREQQLTEKQNNKKS